MENSWWNRESFDHSSPKSIAQDSLDRVAEIFPVEGPKEKGIELDYLNTGNFEDPVAALKDLSGGTGYNDVFVFAPFVEQGDSILAHEGA